MDDMNEFERRFEARVRRFAAVGSRPVDSAALALAVAARHPRRAGTGSVARWLGLSFDFRAGVIALAGFLALALGAGAVVVSGQLAKQAADETTGASGSLIMVGPDSIFFGPDTGEIRVVRPDGQVKGVLRSKNGWCPWLLPDGERVAYWGEAGLTVAPLDGSKMSMIPLDGEGAGAPAADGSRVVYISGVGSEVGDLTIVSLVDGTREVVARGLKDVWALDRSAVGRVAIGYLDGTEFGIDVIEADGSGRRTLTRQPLEAPYPSDLSWSPDGTHLAFRLSPRDDIQLIDVASGRSTLVSKPAGVTTWGLWVPIHNSLHLLWSPDGRTIAYPTEGGLGLLDVASGLSRTLSVREAVIVISDVIVPMWSPDGSRLAFLYTDASGARHLTTIRADLTGRIDQDVAPSAQRQMAWSPDGRQIAVVSSNAIDIHDPDAIEPPTRVSSDVDSTTGHCLSWSTIDTP